MADAPSAMSPVSKLPLSAVNVWVVLSLFLTVIVAPVFAFSGVGENAKSLIVIAVPVVAPALFLLLPQAAVPTASAAIASRARKRACWG